MQRVKTTGTLVTVFITVLAILICMLPVRAFAAELSSSAVFTFSDSGIAVFGIDSGYKIDGTDLTINESGVYTITGSCSEGSITVKKGTTGVTLILEDLTLSSTTTAPLSCNKGTETVLYVQGNVTLNDNESLDNESSDDFEGAAIKVKSENAKLTITGSGILNVNGNCKNGIKGASTATVAITGDVTLNVTALNNGIASDGAVVIESGSINITAGNDGIKSEPDEDDMDSAGTIGITGGSITITAQGDGIQATGNVNITGGSLNITTFGGYTKAGSLGDDSAKGIKSDSQVYIADGSFTLNCADDAIHSNGDVTLTGGSYSIRTGDDGVHADLDLIVGSKGSTGPELSITNSYEGLEGATVTLNSGCGSITASDDGINAATDETVSKIAIYINGGSWTVNADGDGLDAGGDSKNNSGGDIYMNSGVMEVYGSSNDGNAALDFDGTCTYSGGTLLAVGMSGMAQTPTSGVYAVFGQTGMGGQMDNGMRFSGSEVSSTVTAETVGAPGKMGGQQPENMIQPGNQMGGSVSITSGSAVTIADASGNTLYSFTAKKNANSVVFCSDQLVSGGAYTLNINGSTVATATAASGGNGQSAAGNQPGQMGEIPSVQQPEGVPGEQSSGQMENTPAEQPGQSAKQPEKNNTGSSEKTEQASADNQTAFSDVSADQWYAAAVAYVKEHGYMNGTGDGAFAPEDHLSRAQAAQILYNIAGNGVKAADSGFSDVFSGQWYADAVNWAASEGYVLGSDGKFSPDDNITREQLVTILYRFAQKNGYGVGVRGDLSGYGDVSQISVYARAAMEWAVGNGIIQGYDNLISPQGTATRAQMAQILQNFSEKFF